MIGVQINGVDVTVQGDEIIVGDDADTSALLTAMAAKMIARGEEVTLGVSHLTVPAGYSSQYASVATIVEAAVRARLAGIEVVGVVADPGVVY